MVQIDAEDGSDSKWDGWEDDAIVSLFRESKSSHNNLVVFSLMFYCHHAGDLSV
jgi:hypothetical protein